MLGTGRESVSSKGIAPSLHTLKPITICGKSVLSDGQPPKKKPKTWRRGTFNEDPFVFFEKDEKHLMKMKEYYNLKDEFPINQVFHRLRPEKQAGQSEANMGKARNIFFVTK